MDVQLIFTAYKSLVLRCRACAARVPRWRTRRGSWASKSDWQSAAKETRHHRFTILFFLSVRTQYIVSAYKIHFRFVRPFDSEPLVVCTLPTPVASRRQTVSTRKNE